MSNLDLFINFDVLEREIWWKSMCMEICSGSHHPIYVFENVGMFYKYALNNQFDEYLMRFFCHEL